MTGRAVIPGLREAKSPEPRTDAISVNAAATAACDMTGRIGSEFRAQTSGLPRNDSAFPGKISTL